MQTEEPIQILVVDDENGPQEVLRIALSSRGFQVKIAKSGNQACQMFDTEHFDLVLTDLRMPGMSGIDLLRTIRERSPETIVIFITGYASLDSAIEAVREGAYDYLTKPFRIEELYIAVKNATERIKLIKENKKLFEELKTAYQTMEGGPGDINGESKNLELLQSLQLQLLQIYTRTGPINLKIER
ncbi:MAG: sigma-54-dependent Fis family transcriptional regulator [Nitrospirae bacterium]|nr:sigma-54-dependent Fis family transcriptional regulator [Candidatus Manganitrophaceae bacterium]